MINSVKLGAGEIHRLSPARWSVPLFRLGIVEVLIAFEAYERVVYLRVLFLKERRAAVRAVQAWHRYSVSVVFHNQSVRLI